MTAEPVSPAGWPHDLPPPGTGEFEAKVVGWLLDRAPASFRMAAGLTRQPLALGRIVAYTCTGELEALRSAYGAIRRELGDALTAADLADVLTAVEKEGALSAERLRQVDLVVEALAGVRWRARL